MRDRLFFARVILYAFTMLAILGGFWSLLTERAPHVFNSVEEDLSYGWLVPFVSLYVLWQDRKEIRESIGEASAWGVIASIPFFLLGVLGSRGLQVRFEIVGFAGLCWTMAWAFFGWRTAKAVIFPCGFLLFCLPLATFLDVITVHLRLFATGCAYELLKGFGVAIIREGTMLVSPDGKFGIDVAEPCSGLRSIFALMALTAAYAYLTQGTWVRRGILFALSIPLAILGNVMRILTIVLVGMTCSADFAMGFYHDYSGYVVFFVAISLMVGAGSLISRFGGKGAHK